MPALAQLSINLATVRQQWSLIEAAEGCARHGIGTIAPWRDQVAAVGLDEARRAIGANGLQVSGLCRGGMFTGPGSFRAQIDDNLRAIEEAVALDAACLVLVVGGLLPNSRDLIASRQQVADGIARILPDAQAAGMPLAIEPLHPMYAADRACVNTLAQALDICDALGAPAGLGGAVDAYHVWWDPQLAAQITRAGRERLLAYHICDWLVPTRDLLLDRGMMGDGVIDLPGLRALVEATGYTGAHEVEIFSQLDWWTRPPDEVLATCIERHRTAS